jgi:DNA polymerase-3 subunit chi
LHTDTRVDFYILAASEPASRLQFACKLTEKAYGLNNRIYAHVSSQAEAKKLDEMLWTFKQGSFIPHQSLNDSDDERTPVSIGTPEQWENEGELLINLSEAAPEFATNYTRVAEIVDGQEASRQAGRKRFRQYREMGLEPVTHQID